MEERCNQVPDCRDVRGCKVIIFKDGYKEHPSHWKRQSL